MKKQTNIIKQKLFFKAKKVDEKNFIIQGVFSTGGLDRDDEVVDQNGWKLDEFMLNPIVMFAHDHHQPPVGQVIELAKDGMGNLIGAIKFAAAEYDFAMTLFKLYAGGFMRAFSAGFRNDVYEIDNEKDQVLLKENTLYEISCVNVPANAMALAFSKGIDCGPIQKMQDKPVDKSKKKKAIAVESGAKKETIREAIKALTDALNSIAESDNQVVKVEHPKKLGGTKKVPVATLNKAIRQLLAVKKSQ